MRQYQQYQILPNSTQQWHQGYDIDSASVGHALPGGVAVQAQSQHAVPAVPTRTQQYPAAAPHGYCLQYLTSVSEALPGGVRVQAQPPEGSEARQVLQAPIVGACRATTA